MPSLASRTCSAPYIKLPPSCQFHSVSRRLSLGPPHSSARAHCRVGRCLPFWCATGGAQANALLLPLSPPAGGVRLASGTRCGSSSLLALTDPVRTSRCCAPIAADRAAPATRAPSRLSFPDARAAQESVAHPSICPRAPAAAPANARRRRSNLPALLACHPI
ncbi:unnamed protein product [Closterium sp. Naga37s-1]|nr:unnamed protein product [Closterium sp. Naga37s-1]